MKSIVIESTIKVGSRDISSESTYEAEGLLDLNTELPAGKSGELTTRTSAVAGIITLDAGHELTSGAFDIYWPGGVRYGVAGTIDSDELTIADGQGNDLPAQDSAVVASKQVEIIAPLTGNLAIAMVGHCKRRAHLDFQNGAGASLLPLALTANKAWSWAYDLGFTNPLTDQTVAKIMASCGDPDGGGDLSIPILFDAVS